MGTPEHSLVTRRRTYNNDTKHTHKCLYAFMRRRGAWASPNAPSSQDGRTYKEDTKHTHKCLYAFMRRRGAWASPNVPSSQDGRTYKGDTKHTQMLVRLYEEERCMGTPETLPLHKRAERTRKTQNTHTNARTLL